jgi:hypothetical protein
VWKQRRGARAGVGQSRVDQRHRQLLIGVRAMTRGLEARATAGKSLATAETSANHQIVALSRQLSKGVPSPGARAVQRSAESETTTPMSVPHRRLLSNGAELYRLLPLTAQEAAEDPPMADAVRRISLALEQPIRLGPLSVDPAVFARMTQDWLKHVTMDPDLAPLRDDPRFKAMLAETEARLAAAN